MGWQPAYALESGICIAYYDKANYGTYVWLTETSSGNKYLYAHLKNARPPTPQSVIVGPVLKYRVKAGEIIGITDNTGKSTGSHLHFGYKPKGSNAYADPKQLFQNHMQKLSPFKIAFVNASEPVIAEFKQKIAEYTQNKLSLVVSRFNTNVSVPSGTLTTDQAMKLLDQLSIEAQGAFIFYPPNPTSTYEVASFYPARNMAFATSPNNISGTVLIHAFLHLLRKWYNFNKLGPYIEDVEYYPTSMADAGNYNNAGWRFLEQYKELLPYF